MTSKRLRPPYGDPAFEDDHAKRAFDEEAGRRPCRGKPKRRVTGKKVRALTAACPVLEGVVLSRSRGCYQVATPEGELDCSIRGRLRGNEKPVAGDRVCLRPVAGGGGVLEEVLPRKNQLLRVSEEDERQHQTIVANLDLLVVVLAVSPAPRWALADRLLAVAERQGFDPLIVINKIDLAAEGSPERSGLDAEAAVYRGLNVPVLYTSALYQQGIDELRQRLKEKKSVFSGHSGVGKSTLLNALQPELRLKIGEVNAWTGKGRHTTSMARFLRLKGGGWVADTPGFREFGLGDMQPADLGRCYPEFRPFISQCRFQDCLHQAEPGCALKPALEEGAVSKLRYQNYLQILRGLVK
ncbi:MAG: ribosome small subunit-dependent GTPase A [Planctomycetes bacterium]|nr:ribosome small subunit-dependent GTPase A [Planctomycetota bacterium]